MNQNARWNSEIYKCSSTLYLTPTLGAVGGQHHDAAALSAGERPRGWVGTGPFWTGAENLAPTRIWSPERPARSESLYRLSYRGPYCTIIRNLNCIHYYFFFSKIEASFPLLVQNVYMVIETHSERLFNVRCRCRIVYVQCCFITLRGDDLSMVCGLTGFS